MDEVATFNSLYQTVLSITVFTSTLKFCKMLSFHKAFMQISATIKLCFSGLSTFVVEFLIVFCAFCSFFFFVLKNDLENFRDFLRTFENTLAMSIGKFNFSALREADTLAAWIFFVFSSKSRFHQRVVKYVYYINRNIWFISFFTHKITKLFAIFTMITSHCSCCEHDFDQHDDGHYQFGLWRNQRK